MTLLPIHLIVNWPVSAMQFSMTLLTFLCPVSNYLTSAFFQPSGHYVLFTHTDLQRSVATVRENVRFKTHWIYLFHSRCC